VVQGFGNVGSMAADLMQKAGYKSSASPILAAVLQ